MIYPKIGTPQKGHFRPKHNDKTKHDKTNHRILGYNVILFFDTPVAIEVRAETRFQGRCHPGSILHHLLVSLGRSWQILAAWNVGMLRGLGFSESIKRRRCMTLLCQGNEVHLQATQLRWTLMQEKDAAICPAV